MKKVFLASALALAMACGNANNDQQLQADAHAHHHHGAAAAKGEEMTAPTDASLYNLESHWLNQHGDSIMLNNLQGKVQLVSLVYTSCQYACPRIVADMKNIEAAVVDTWGHQVGFVLVSIDPQHDTPEKLKEFAEKNGFSPHRWQLLHGSDDSVLELAALLGVQYKRTDERDFSHSNVITILNPAGEIKHQQLGLGVNPDQTIAAIQEQMAAHMAKRNHKHH